MRGSCHTESAQGSTSWAHQSDPHQPRGEGGPGSPRCLPLLLCSKHSGDARSLWKPGSPRPAVLQRLALFFAAIAWMFSSKRLRLHS